VIPTNEKLVPNMFRRPLVAIDAGTAVTRSVRAASWSGRPSFARTSMAVVVRPALRSGIVAHIWLPPNPPRRRTPKAAKRTELLPIQERTGEPPVDRPASGRRYGRARRGAAYKRQWVVADERSGRNSQQQTNTQRWTRHDEHPFPSPRTIRRVTLRIT
jgi:hypothetical protein